MKPWQAFVLAMIAIRLGDHVQTVFERHGPIAAMMALFFVLVAIEIAWGWLRWLTSRR